MNFKTKNYVLSGVSCAGVVATMIFTHKSTIKAERSDKKSIIHYIPALTCGGATVASILLNQHLTNKYVAGLIGTAGVSGRLFREFEANARKMFGDTKVDEIHRQIAKDHENGITYAIVPELSAPGLMTSVPDPKVKGDLLFYDEFTDIWFRSSFAAVKNAEYHLNRNFVLGADISLEEFYEFLGVELPEQYHGFCWGDYLIEDGITWLDFHHYDAYSQEKDENYIIIRYDYEPIHFGLKNIENEFFVRR